MVKSYINLAEEVGNKMNTQLISSNYVIRNFIREWLIPLS